MTYHLGADYFEDPDGTFVSQPKKYIDKLVTFFPSYQIRHLTPNLVPTLQIHYTYENPMDCPQYWTIGLSSSNLSCGIKIIWGLQ